jgi:hypothetical protein
MKKARISPGASVFEQHDCCVGAAASGKTGDPATGDFGDAMVIRKFALRPYSRSCVKQIRKNER